MKKKNCFIILNQIENGVNQTKMQIPTDFIKQVSWKSPIKHINKKLYVFNDDEVERTLKEKGFIK